MRHKRKAAVNIGLDLDPLVIASWKENPAPDITLVCDDAVAFLRRYAFTGQEFVYADPPYLLKTRRSGPRYRYEYTDKQHRALLACLKGLCCKVMISGYWSALYAAELRAWQILSFEAVTRGGTVATEWVWMNYAAPVELHDYRYLGASFRERERIKRKMQRWTKRLEAMPRLERQALYAALSKVPLN